MDTPRLLRIERYLLEAEYLLDSTASHVRAKRCDDIKPLALRRVQRAINKVRAARDLTRLAQGARHPTLFAGGADPRSPANDPLSGRPGARGMKQKRWGTKRPHGWRKDCEGRDGKA